MSATLIVGNSIKIHIGAIALALITFVLSFTPASAYAVGEGAQTFTLDGRLYSDAAATTPLLDSNATVKIQILNQAQDCILYEETQAVNTSGSNGYFAILVGSATSGAQAAKRGANDSGHAMAVVYSNTATNVSGKLVTNGAACTYSPASGDERYLRMQVTQSADGVTRTLSPNTPIDSVPSAVVAERAESLQGLLPNQILQVGTGDLTQANLQSVFATGNAAKLTSLLSIPPANYVTVSSSNGTVQLPAASAPASPTAGQIWYDSGVLKYYNGSAVQTLGVSGSGITSLGIGAGLTPTGTITTGGSTIAVDVGTSAGQIVQVQTGGKLPALDGSNLTNLNGSAIQSGTIGGTTAISTSGNIQTSQDVTAKRVFVQDSGTNFVGLKAPTTVTATYNLTFPAAQGGANTYLMNDGAGNLSWVTQNSGSVTAVSGTAPISITGTAQAPIVGISKADAATDGYLAQADWTTFNNKQSTSLASANIWVGSAGGVATAQAPSGDISMTNAGVFTVGGIKGKTVSSAPILAGQVLRYDGTNITPNFVAMGDLRSNVTGTQALASSCTAAQTLTYDSLMDNLTCSNIAIASTAVSGLGTAATLNTGTGANNVVQLDGSSKLPAVDGSALTSLNASNISSGTLNASRLPSSVVLNGGNSFGAASTIGNNDNFDLGIKTNNSTRMTITAGGNVGIGTTAPAAKIDVQGGTANISNTIGSFAVSPIHTANGTYIDYATNWYNNAKIAAGVTNSGAEIGAIFSSVRNYLTTADSGALSQLAGQQIAYGHYNSDATATPTTTLAAGLVIQPYYKTGSITTMYDLYIGPNSTGGTVTNHYGIYQLDSATNYFSGNVGIGMTTPATQLHVSAPTSAPAITVGDSSTGGNYGGILNFTTALTGLANPSKIASSLSGQADNSTGGRMIFSTSSTGGALTERMRIDAFGNVGIGTTSPGYKLDVLGSGGSTVAHFSDGTQTCSITPSTAGNISCSSDQRLKKDITPFDDVTSLENILQLNTVTYHWKTGDDKFHTGYIAQEVEKVAPEFVVTGKDGFKQVSYVGFIPWITGAIKAIYAKFNARFEALENQNAALEKENAALKTQLEQQAKELSAIKQKLGM